MKTLLTLIAPGALTLISAALLLKLLPDNNAALVQASSTYPLVALALAMILAWRMHRSRLLAAAMLLIATYALLQAAAPTGAQEGLLANASRIRPLEVELAALLVPLLIAILAVMGDRHVAGRTAVIQIAIVAAPIGAAAALYFLAGTQTLTVLGRSFVNARMSDWSGMPQITLALTILSIALATALAVIRGRATDAGLAWAALAGVLMISVDAGTERGIWMLAAGLVLIVALIETAYVLAYHDELTGLPARRSLAQTLAALRPPYTVAVVDVDHFKTFNDRYGHDVGDDVLRMVAGKLASVTGGGRAYRSGGEEFTIVFPGKPKDEALPHVEQVREAVEQARFTIRTKPRPKKNGERKRGSNGSNERRIGVTISIGLAGVDKRHPTTDAVVKAADKAMYRAKQGGRNQVVA